MSVAKILQYIPQGIFRNKLYKEINSNRIKHREKRIIHTICVLFQSKITGKVGLSHILLLFSNPKELFLVTFCRCSFKYLPISTK